MIYPCHSANAPNTPLMIVTTPLGDLRKSLAA